jgi:hypothetical protein
LILSKKGRNVGPHNTKLLVTNLAELTPRQVVSMYQKRWAVELFQSQDIKFTWGPFFFWSVTTGGSSKGNT